jgi:hypothetical protein
MTTEREDLVAAVLAARDALHPELDAEFLRDVVAAESDSPDSPEGAVRALEAAVTAALAREGG